MSRPFDQKHDERHIPGIIRSKVLVPQEINLLITSDPTQGASNVSAAGDQFEIELSDGIKIPRDAKNVDVQMQESTVWWVVPNILTGINDRFDVKTSAPLPVVTYNVILPQGLYDLNAFNQSVQRELSNLGAPTSPDPLISFLPDDATQKVELQFNYIGVQVVFGAQSPTTILGFNVGNVPAAPSTMVGQVVLAPNTAAFNQVNYFLVHSDLVSRGLRINNTYNQTIGQVLIDVPPGSQIVTSPFNPAKIESSELAGAVKTRLRFWITDDKNRSINMNNEYWTARILITYLAPIEI